MKQIQRKRLLYAISCCSILLSSLLWTAVLASMQMQYWNEEGEGVEERDGREVREGKEVKEGKEGTGVVEADLSASVLEKVSEHFESSAPPEITSGITDTHLSKEESLNAGSKSELAQWELTNTYTISIPSIGVRSSLYKPSKKFWDTQEWTLLEEQMQVGLAHGAVVYPHSAEPGRRGSLIVAGHSSPPNERAKQSAFGHLFAKLPELTAGDEIIVGSGDTRVTYQVRDSKVVSASAVSVLAQQHSESVLKLITCFPIGTTRDRLLVTAVPVG